MESIVASVADALSRACRELRAGCFVQAGGMHALARQRAVGLIGSPECYARALTLCDALMDAAMALRVEPKPSHQPQWWMEFERWMLGKVRPEIEREHAGRSKRFVWTLALEARAWKVVRYAAANEFERHICAASTDHRRWVNGAMSPSAKFYPEKPAHESPPRVIAQCAIDAAVLHITDETNWYGHMVPAAQDAADRIYLSALALIEGEALRLSAEEGHGS